MTIESISNAASSPPHLTFIGAGHLAQAMAAGILASGEGFQPPIALTARRTSHAKALQERFPDALVMLDNQAPELWCSSRLHGSSSHILFICTRPADVPTAITQLLPVLAGCPVDRRPTIVTMCPGIRLSQLESWLPADTAIVRSMPNTPLEVGAGSTALSANVAAAHSVADVEAVFRTVCPAVCLVEEDMLDVVAAVSGSAPAYFYYLIEALTKAAESYGLPADTAETLITQSCIGAGLLARRAARPVRMLRQEVCVPGGSTEQAISNLEKSHLPQIVASSVETSVRANHRMSEME